MKHLPKPKPYRPYKPVFVEYVKSVTPLDISEGQLIKITDELKNIYRESQKDKK